MISVNGTNLEKNKKYDYKLFENNKINKFDFEIFIKNNKLYITKKFCF